MLKMKQGQCIQCGRTGPIYAKKLCPYCYKKQSFKGHVERKPTKLQRKVTGEGKMFEEIWEERPIHVSAVSGISISDYEYRTRKCFAHVLPKGKYPLFRLNKENIVYLTWSEHTFWDNRTKDEFEKRLNRGENWAYMLKLQERLLQEYPTSPGFYIQEAPTSKPPGNKEENLLGGN